MTIGERLKNLRLGKKLTLEDVGQALNITKQTLYKYENGIITNIPSDKIERLAVIYDVQPEYIMGWTQNKLNNSVCKLQETNSADEYNCTSRPITIAAHALDDLDEEELEKVYEYIAFLKSKKKTE